MKIAIYRSALISALDRVMKVMPSSKLSPVLNYVLFRVEEDYVEITATDLSNFITVRVKEVKVAQKGQVLLPAAELYSAAKTVLNEGVVIFDENNTVKLKAGKTSWSWNVLNSEVFPKIPQWEQSKVYTLECKSFVRAMRSVKPAAAFQSFSTNLEQVGFSQGNMQASDGSRFHQVFVEDVDLQVAFPLSYVNDLISVLSIVEEETFELGVTSDETAIVIKCSNLVLSCKTKAEKFPDISSAFLVPSMKNYIELKVDVQELVGSIKRVQVTANKDTRTVKLVLSTKNTSSMDLICSKADGSYSKDSISIEGPLESREIVLSLDHLLQALNLFEGSVTLKFAPDQKNKPSTILIQDGKNFVVLNQLRVVS